MIQTSLLLPPLKTKHGIFTYIPCTISPMILPIFYCAIKRNLITSSPLERNNWLCRPTTLTSNN